jgi:hypothetical protein
MGHLPLQFIRDLRLASEVSFNAELNYSAEP